ncbi:MAG: integrase [Nitratireductor sp.]|nr:integrase [Nitratireductor sp.]
MVLKMNRPSKRPESSFLQFRKRVPKDLRPIIGKTEIKISLGTRDPITAKQRHAELAAEIEAQWMELRKGVRTVSQKEASAIAGEIYREKVAAHEDNPGRPGEWRTRVMLDQIYLRPEKVAGKVIIFDEEIYHAAIERGRLGRHRRVVDEYLSRKGYRVDTESHIRITEAVNLAMLLAHEHIYRLADGDYRPDPEAERFAKFTGSTAADGVHLVGQERRASPLDLFDRYSAESKLKPATIKRWRPIVASVEKEHPNLSDITVDWAISWKNRLVASGLSNNSIRNAYLASMRSLCNWAVTNREIPSNPFATVTLKADKKRKLRPKGFTDGEALTILRATFDPAPEGFSREHAAARRWVPWLCAYLGARVGEVSQLRAQDIRQEDGIWLVWITPDAGSTKNESARHVALHPHLIEQGFLAFVQKSGPGPLFYDPKRSRNGSEMNPQSKKIGERIAKWVRELGITDRSVLPNHAWRHRFKTTARKVMMDVGARDYMQGHVPATEGEAYGDFPPDVLLHEISKLPRYEVDLQLDGAACRTPTSAADPTLEQ